MMDNSALYNPKSKVMFVLICSLHKKEGGDKKYYSQESIVSRLSTEMGLTLQKKEMK
jgi:hypothetical protein